MGPANRCAVAFEKYPKLSAGSACLSGEDQARVVRFESFNPAVLASSSSLDTLKSDLREEHSGSNPVSRRNKQISVASGTALIRDIQRQIDYMTA